MMNKRILRLFPIIMILWVICRITTANAASSMFSGIGYGLLQDFHSSRSAGMGGAALALNDTLSLNYLNPAALAGIQQARVSMGGYFLNQEMRDHNAMDVDGWAQVEHFALALRLKSGFTIGFFLYPFSRSEYRYGWSGEVSGANYYQSLQGTGGLSRAALNAAVALGNWGKIGGGLGVIWGQVEELRGSYFQASGYEDIEFLTSKQWLAFAGSAGLMLHPTDRLTIGAVFEPEIPIQLDQSFTYEEDDSIAIYEAEYRLAALYGLGLSWQLSLQFLSSAQILYRPWDQLNDLPGNPADYRNSLDVSAGIEWAPGNWESEHFLRRLMYRFGGRWESGYVQSEGNSIQGYFASAGISYPFRNGRHSLDVAVEYGLRGDLSSNGGQENILKVRFGLNLGGSWFVRAKPSWED